MDGIPDAMKKSLFWGSLLLVILGMTWAGCAVSSRNMPQKIVPYEESVIPTAGALPTSEVFLKRPQLGHFNIQKRHGLGGWVGNPAVISEHELLQKLAKQR